eukprot:4872872-Heterocapsa_arctica.AAC.1
MLPESFLQSRSDSTILPSGLSFSCSIVSEVLLLNELSAHRTLGLLLVVLHVSLNIHPMVAKCCQDAIHIADQ